ncbi:unnamed protein product [Paramecium octaurelia]|uniref:Ligand-effect modulator 3 LEM3 family protein n=1 Tax=Paramecium octaurelia TaxID=43137 RepID=A0A8S1SIF0_PAROT|nr:unnamed protein product [Paramecium octaurelia]
MEIYYLLIYKEMDYNKINNTSSNIFNESSQFDQSRQEDVVNFLREPKASKKLSYQYPVVEEASSYWDRLLAGRLDSISLIPTTKCAVFTLFLISFYMGLFGLILFGVSTNIVEIRIPYGEACDQQSFCNITFFVDELMATPVYVYYELSNFYSNDLNFVKSINKDQLMGYDIDQEKYCPNAYLQSQMIRQNISASGHHLYLDNANPCGLAAKYIFNDTFYIMNTEKLTINVTNLLLPMYKKQFKRHEYYFKQWLDVENEQVESWFIPQVHSSRFILYGIINGNLNQGSYKFYVNNQYPISIFGGEKTLILQSASELGTKGLTIGLVLLGGSGLSALSSLMLFMLKRNKSKTQVQQEQI